MTDCANCAAPLKRHGLVNYFCVGCCLRLLRALPTRDARAAHLASIERVCGYEHAEQVKAEFIKTWEGRGK